jgi:alkanesulfonate monooxygenase SsuD/methylene tetrahydromethanopterin reductase-like flavin-dependent oxidoreductase (luciferase family)
MKKATAALQVASREAGINRDPIVLYGVQPILGGTEAEAKRRAETLIERIPLPAILARLSGVLGHDLSRFDPDDPLEDMDTQASKGLMAATASSADGAKITLREAASRWALSVAIPQVIGTPEQVADRITDMWRETRCAGFNLSPTTNPDSVNDFVDQVVPILQRKGVFRREYTGSTLREHLH